MGESTRKIAEKTQKTVKTTFRNKRRKGVQQETLHPNAERVKAWVRVWTETSLWPQSSHRLKNEIQTGIHLNAIAHIIKWANYFTKHKSFLWTLLQKTSTLAKAREKCHFLCLDKQLLNWVTGGHPSYLVSGKPGAGQSSPSTPAPSGNNI